MAKWVVVVSGEQYESERLYGGEALSIAGGRFTAGDEALLVAAVSPAVVFGLARAEGGDRLRYTVNRLDAPLPAGGVLASIPTRPAAPSSAAAETGEATGLGEAGEPGKARETEEAGEAEGVAQVGAWVLGEEAYQAIARRAVADESKSGRERRTWLVSVDMPIEAASPGDAVRAFWSYVRELGPAELPAFVWPAGDELAMQAYVLGAEANQDPEED
ncbi:hypothetical protein [Dactylosporangium darangshiense]|uniref:Uncharacterized protein n=1 Tax=Dactylosporangium darangshiense TaxID=579108 RepID=A0ABP8D4H5_9ACTN